MKLNVTGRQLEISDAVRALIVKKLGHLDRLLNDNALSAQCVISRERNQMVCDLTIRVRGDHTLHSVGRHARLPGALAAAVAKIDQQARKLLGRWNDKRRRAASGRSAPIVPPIAAASAEPAGPRVIRARRYQVRTVTTDDAALMVANGPETFLLFRNVLTGALTVAYRRSDGNVGLIEPEP